MSEHAVLIRFFDYEARFGRDLAPLHALEDEIALVIEQAGVGELDGNEMALDGSEGTFFAYGPDARAIFAALEVLLRASRVTYDAEVTLCFGDPGDPDAREEVIKLSGPEPHAQ